MLHSSLRAHAFGIMRARSARYTEIWLPLPSVLMLSILQSNCDAVSSSLFFSALNLPGVNCFLNKSSDVPYNARQPSVVSTYPRTVWKMENPVCASTTEARAHCTFCAAPLTAACNGSLFSTLQFGNRSDDPIHLRAAFFMVLVPGRFLTSVFLKSSGASAGAATQSSLCVYFPYSKRRIRLQPYISSLYAQHGCVRQTRSRLWFHV